MYNAEKTLRMTAETTLQQREASLQVSGQRTFSELEDSRAHLDPSVHSFFELFIANAVADMVKFVECIPIPKKI